MATRAIRDDDGEEVKAGDEVHFSYGIPPVGVVGFVEERHDGRLIVLTPHHKPGEVTLAWLRRHHSFWKL